MFWPDISILSGLWPQSAHQWLTAITIGLCVVSCVACSFAVAMRIDGPCRCSHLRADHAHYRRGIDCGICGCPQYRPVRRTVGRHPVVHRHHSTRRLHRQPQRVG